MFGSFTKQTMKLLAIFHQNHLNFEPHITLGNSVFKNTCQQMIAEWNDKNIIIKGSVSSIDFVKYEAKILQQLKKLN